MQSSLFSFPASEFGNAWLTSVFDLGDSVFAIFGDNFDTSGDLGLSSVFTFSLSICTGVSSSPFLGEILLSMSLLGELDLFESLATLFCGLGFVEAQLNITGDVLVLGRFALDELSTLKDGETRVRAGR